MNSAPAIPFIHLPGSSLAFSNPEDFGSVLGRFLPLTVHGWDQPQRGERFVNHCGVIRIGDLTLLSTWGSAIRGDVEQRCEAQLVLPFGQGRHHYQLGGLGLRFRRSSLFIAAAGHRVRIHSSLCEAVVISFPPESLLPVAQAIAGPRFDGLALQAALEQSAILHRSLDARRDRMQRLLMEAMAFAERSVAIGGEVHPMLRLDDLVRRLIVMLLLPDLADVAQVQEVAETPFVHAGLVEWLLAHLDEPISLSDMEQHSNYSRRSLQVAFKQRFGCGPMQWLRRQRLAKARTLLEQPGGCRSLSQVALACGYLSAASFSRDYLARYGERPSRVWRRLRQVP